LCTAEMRSFTFIVKGPFTHRDFLNMADSLEEHANVNNSLFLGKGETSEAMATFFVSTHEKDERLREVLAQVSGIEIQKITKEGNDGKGDGVE